MKESNKPENTFVATDFSFQHTFDSTLPLKSNSRCFQVENAKVTLKHAGGKGSCDKTLGTDMVCIPSILIKTSQLFFE